MKRPNHTEVVSAWGAVQTEEETRVKKKLKKTEDAKVRRLDTVTMVDYVDSILVGSPKTDDALQSNAWQVAQYQFS